MFEQRVNSDVLTVSTVNSQDQVTQKPLRDSVKQALKNYFAQLNGQDVNDLYELVLAEVEQPLLDMVMQYTQPGYATPGHYSPGIAGDYSTVNQPVSQHRQKLLSCRRYWLSRYGFAVCRHRAESDGASHRDDSHDHVGLSDYQPDYLAADEYL